jgi:hypothetical protein
VVVGAGDTGTEAAAHGEPVTDELTRINRTTGPDPPDWAPPDNPTPASPSTASSAGRSFGSGRCAHREAPLDNASPELTCHGVRTAGE